MEKAGTSVESSFLLDVTMRPIELYGLPSELG
jgi:hypothetical protein